MIFIYNLHRPHKGGSIFSRDLSSTGFRYPERRIISEYTYLAAVRALSSFFQDPDVVSEVLFLMIGLGCLGRRSREVTIDESVTFCLRALLIKRLPSMTLGSFYVRLVLALSLMTYEYEALGGFFSDLWMTSSWVKKD